MSEASGQTAGNSTAPDTSRKSILKLQNDPALPWEKKPSSPFFLNNPSNIRETVVYDAEKNEYIIYKKAGSLDYRPPVHMSPA